MLNISGNTEPISTNVVLNAKAYENIKFSPKTDFAAKIFLQNVVFDCCHKNFDSVSKIASQLSGTA